MKRLALALLFLPTLASAQDYTPPSKDLWTQMTQAIQGVSMPLTAHQQISNILSATQQQAAQEKSNAKQEPKASPDHGSGVAQPQVR